MTIRNATRRLWFHCTSTERQLRRSARLTSTLLLVAFANGVVFAADPPPDSTPPPAPSLSVPAIPLSPLATPAVVPADFHDEVSGVDIYAQLTDDMFPMEWHDPAVAVAALPLAASEKARAMRLMKIALSKYAPDFLKLNLKRVYLIGGLKFEGIDAAATNSSESLFIEDEANNPLYTDRFVEDSFHHELAHLIQRNYRDEWSVDAWTKCNPADFRYGSASGVEAVRSGHDSEEPTDDWNRKGFLCEYGASDAAEDFATIVADLLIGDNDFWKRVDRFPTLKTKVQVAIGFYAKLNDRFTENYFRSLRPGLAYVPPPIPTLSPISPVNAPTATATVAAPTEPTKPDSTGPAAKP